MNLQRSGEGLERRRDAGEQLAIFGKRPVVIEYQVF